jgi:hypothetical protein
MGIYVGDRYFVGFMWWGLHAELLSYDIAPFLECYRDSYMEVA